MPNPGCPTPFNFWLGWPGASKPWVMRPGVHQSIAYLNAHLHYLSNQNTPTCSSTFSWATGQAVENYRRFWGLGPVYGRHWQVVDDHMWAVLDFHTSL